MKDITKILFGALVIPIGLLIYNFVSCIINNHREHIALG